ncbi:MAG TPA: HlyD family efflux transporter periplasmic adaptor subunit [Bacteroidales bacterium]|nr:HlyD family efflux transporter periplasmic adaptor subunit [Bacteroidales bacterium]
MRKTILFTILAAAAFTACNNKNSEADAYGNFEAREVTVSSEATGRVVQFSPSEGSLLKKNDVVAVIDTTLLILQRNELNAAMKGVRTKLLSTDAQNAILLQQIENLNINIDRTTRMLAEEAAPEKQMDDLRGQKAVIEKQIAANSTQKNSISAELQAYESKMATLNEQIARATIKSPIDGTLIQKYAEEGELTASGRPLAKIADLNEMKLKVYVSGAEIGSIKTGQECEVRIDEGEDSFRNFKGIVSYISPNAEFTPKIIQTKEERVTLVYAVTINVQNDGSIKSGMPGEAIF